MGRIFGGRGRPPRRPTADASGEDEVGHAQADGAALEAVDHDLIVVVEGDLHRGGAIVPHAWGGFGRPLFFCYGRDYAGREVARG